MHKVQVRFSKSFDFRFSSNWKSLHNLPQSRLMSATQKSLFSWKRSTFFFTNLKRWLEIEILFLTNTNQVLMVLTMHLNCSFQMQSIKYIDWNFYNNLVFFKETDSTSVLYVLLHYVSYETSLDESRSRWSEPLGMPSIKVNLLKLWNGILFMINTNFMPIPRAEYFFLIVKIQFDNV